MKQKLFRLMLVMLAVIMIGSTQAAKKVWMLGDSTMTIYDDSEPTGGRGWGMYFGNFLTNGWTRVNMAKGGRDARAGYKELWASCKNDVEAGDYVIIQFAHNDSQFGGIDNQVMQDYYASIGDETNRAAVASDGRGTNPSTTYKEWMKKVIDEAKEKGAIPVLVSAVCRCQLDANGKMRRGGRHDLGGSYNAIVDGVLKTGLSLPEDDHTMDFGYHMKQLAIEEGVAFVDMTTATQNLYESYGTQDKCHAALFDKKIAANDGTHYNLTGALTAARLCAQLMKEQGILADNIEVPADMSFNPSSADMGDIYVGQAATKEVTLSALGLDPAEGTVTITASDGIQISYDKQNWDTQLTADYEMGTLIKTFYAKVAVSAVGSFSGTVTASLGSKNVLLPVTVNGIELGGGDPFTATWALTSDDKATTTEGVSVTAADASYTGLGTYGHLSGYGALIAPDGATGAWSNALIDRSLGEYVEFGVTAPEGRKLDINRIAMKIKAQGGGSIQCHIYYSTDNFATETQYYNNTGALNGEWKELDKNVVVQLDEGETLKVRVFPWSANVDNGRWLCISDVEIDGQSKDAAGVNIGGTITYTLDKGGLNQGDDAIIDPTEMSAGIAMKKWTAGSAITVSGTTDYQGATGESNIKQTKIAATNGTSSSAGKDNTMTLTITPEDGYSFVPSKVSFQSARYGTDGGNIGVSIAAGDAEQELVSGSTNNVNRSGKSLTIASFAEPVTTSITATADNPLKVNFSFVSMGANKSMGLSNVVIEGTLVGAATQSTKYLLTTTVVPAEAGTITRDPDMEMYKENSSVTLKATRNFGYKLKEWQDGNGTVVGTDESVTVTMDEAKTIKAVFEAIPVYKVTAEAVNDDERDMGSVTLTPNEHNGQYEAGTKITATAEESKILKFLSWTDEYDNNGASATREITVNSDMTLVANYEVQDFIAVFDATKAETWAYQTTAGYPFPADQTWDSERNAKSSIVKVSDGSLAYTQNGGTPVVRNRKGAVLSNIYGLYQNGYRTTDIAFQYQFSTKGFTSATFVAEMAAKNMANKYWKALISTDGENFSPVSDTWTVSPNVTIPINITLPATAIEQETVYIRITGEGTDLLSSSYAFDQQFDGLDYCSHSETGVGNVYILGDAVVVADEEAPVVTGTVPADNAASISATGNITVSFDERIQAVDGATAATLNGETVTPTWNSRSVSFAYKALEYGQTYTFTMPANYVQDRSGNKYGEAVTITFTVMERPTVAKALYDFVVPDDGTITEALAAANDREDKTTRFRVFIKNSTEPYVFDPNGTTTGGDGNTYPDPRSHLTASNTSFIGESLEGVVITNQTPEATWNNGFGNACPLEGIGNGDVLIIEKAATDSYFQNLTIKTSMGDAHGRDIAVQDLSNRTIFKDAQLWGYQDTYVSNNQNGRFYFEGGVIRGRTDFMCGKGDVYYNKVTLRQVKDGYTAVPSVPKKYGYIYQDCKIIGDASDVDGSYTLGRPWGKGTPIALFINTEMEVKPSATGWSEMSGGYPARFAEYGSHTPSGATVSTEGRKTFFDAYDARTEVIGADGQKTYEYTNRRNESNNPVLTAEEAAVPTLQVVMGQDDDWLPTLLTEQAPVPTNVVANEAVLTWDDSNYALLWAVCKDGAVVDFTTEPTYEATENGSYTVRAANEMGGLSAMSVAVEITGITGINGIDEAKNATKAIFTIDGRSLNTLQRGLNIIRMSDGSVQKVLVK